MTEWYEAERDDPVIADRLCPFCDEPQFWSPGDDSYSHMNNRLHCDEERLAYWDSREMRKGLSDDDD